MALAVRLGWHSVTIAKYETGKAPDLKALAQLEQLAASVPVTDVKARKKVRGLSAVFRTAAIEKFGIAYGDYQGSHPIIHRGQEAYVCACLEVLSQPQWAKERVKLLKILKPVLATYDDLSEHIQKQLAKGE
jgi:hypothetical protein